MDLQAGPLLRVIVPLLKSEGFIAKFAVVQDDGEKNLTVSSNDVVGYTTSSFAIKSATQGKVRLELVSTEESKDGKTLPRQIPRKLPFALPQKAAHIRLLYLIHYSAADHGLAILASERVDALDTFTKRMIEDPSACQQAGSVFCSLVPAGIGVRTEKP